MIIYSDHDKPPLDELTHYGVKGMKWGVRRELKREAKSRYKTFTNQQVARHQYLLSTWEISESQYKSMSEKPIKLGKNFNRIAKTDKLRDFVYVTNNERDRNIYKAVFGPEGKKRNLKNKNELTIKTNKEVVSPGKKVRVDTYIDTLREGFKSNPELQKMFGGAEAAKALNAREIGFKTYNQFVQTQHMGTSIHSAYFNNLRKKGYNAVLDDADGGWFSNTPVILFPKESGARVTEIKPVTKDDILTAKSNLELLD